MKTLQQAASNWAADTRNSGQKWASKANNPQAYCEGWAKFAGTSPAQCMQRMGPDFSRGIQEVGAAGFDSSIAGKEGAYIRGVQNAS